MAGHTLQCKDCTSPHSPMMLPYLYSSSRNVTALDLVTSEMLVFRSTAQLLCSLTEKHTGVARVRSTQFFIFKIMGNQVLITSANKAIFSESAILSALSICLSSTEVSAGFQKL